MHRICVRAIAIACLAQACVAYAVAGHAGDAPRVYFNHDARRSYVEPYRGIERAGSDLEAILVERIAAARERIDLAVQELQLPRIAWALSERQRAGVRVRVVLENQYSTPLSELTPEQVARLGEYERAKYDEFVRLVDRNRDGVMSTEEIHARDALIVLRDAGVRWIDDTADGSKGSGLMHHKILVIDQSEVVVTSANYTTSDIHGDFLSASSRGNPNALVVFESPELAGIFTQEFELLWIQHRFGLQKPARPPRTVRVPGAAVTVQFSPVSKKHGWESSVNGLIERELLKTRRSADLALFVFSEQRLVNALDAARGLGAGVRALIEPSFAYRNYSEMLDMLGVALLDKKCRYEAGNRPWLNPIGTTGIPVLPPGDKLHHKFAALDGQRVLFGSHNWSNAANHLNDETFLVIESQAIAAEFEREFEAIYGDSVLGAPDWLMRRIREQEKLCSGG